MERPELAEELERMATEDLAVRERLAKTGELFNGYHPAMRAVHRRNGDRLTQIVDQLGCWPGHSLVGRDGSLSAFLIAQHDIANPALIRRCRDLYAAAIDNADAEPARLAQLEDRIRYFEGRLQWYGTHWGWNEEGQFGPWPPVDEPDKVDERRRALGLPPLAEAISVSKTGRPSRRPVEEVLHEHRQADDFAQEVGWRTPAAAEDEGRARSTDDGTD